MLIGQESKAQSYAIGADLSFMKLAEAGVFPDMVQVGNEISSGMLWPDGKLPGNRDNFVALLQAGINGVHASCGNNPCPVKMIHIDKGGDKQFTEYFFDKLHIVLDIPDNRGKGVFWWEPAVSRRGSRSFFDESGNVLPVITVFDKYMRL
jgi:arabinogalactan endo-1,4-beta-galactosidase